MATIPFGSSAASIFSRPTAPGSNPPAIPGPLGGILGRPGNYQGVPVAGQATGVVTAPVGGGGGGGQTADSNLSAEAILRNLLHPLGLDALLNDAMGWVAEIGGFNADYILFKLRQTPQYAARFPGMAARQKAGLPAISEGDYIAYETAARQMMREAGLPTGFYDDPNDFANFIGTDVSVSELRSRVSDGYAAAMAAPADVRDELGRLYNVGAGDLAAFFLDPQRALPIIQRQFAASQLGGASKRTGYGLLTQGEAEQLAALGVSDTQAQQSFTDLTSMGELFQPLPGETGAETIARQRQLQAAFAGSSADQRAIAAARARRQAEFAGGAGFTAGQKGTVGLSTAVT